MSDPRTESELTFEHFIATRGTAEALEQSKALASGRPAPRLLVLHGPPGVGKTHLLHAIAHAARHGPRSLSVMQTSATELVEEMITLLRRDLAADRRQFWAATGLVTVDDLHVLKSKMTTQQEIGLWLRAALNRGARLACAAGCDPSEVPVLVETLRGAPECGCSSFAVHQKPTCGGSSVSCSTRRDWPYPPGRWRPRPPAATETSAVP